MSKHTPGPWNFRKAAKHFHIEASAPDFGSSVAEVLYSSNQDTGWTSEANAALIAAAPELLEEMQRTNDLALELMERAATIDRLLIAKDGREPDCELGEIVRLRQQLGRNRAALKKAGAK